MTGETIAARFPVPRQAILDQIPEELHRLFGEQADPEPEVFSDEIDYVYEVKRQDGSPFEALLYCEYVLQGAPSVAFAAGDRIHLDGIAVEVVRWDMFPEGVAGDGRRYWRVLVAMPEGEGDQDG